MTTPATDTLLLEWLSPHVAMGLAGARFLERIRSPHQLVEVVDTPAFGKLLRLDGRCMASERDEFFYHELLTHPAALTHPHPRRALVVGGGDGGSAKELLKHHTLERVVVVELDAVVVDVARRHLPAVHRGAFDDPRLSLVIDDAVGYAQRTAERFDFIVIELAGRDAASSPLYSAAFFARCNQLLAPGGALSLHLASPVRDGPLVRTLALRLQEHFAIVRPLVLHVPLYAGLWSFAVASQTLDPTASSAEHVARTLAARGITDLRYYTPTVHGALFALPRFVEHLLADDGRAAP